MEIDNLIKGADILRFSKAQRIKWLGHIQRMDQARPTRKLLDWKPMGTRPIGRPRQRWQEDVMEDLKKLKVKNWKETAKDRRSWRDLTEKAKTHEVAEVLLKRMFAARMRRKHSSECSSLNEFCISEISNQWLSLPFRAASEHLTYPRNFDSWTEKSGCANLLS
jgi:hypothetical protein